MKISLFIFLLFPLILSAQKIVPRFENDTLYTTSGYKFYKGETLYFAKGTGSNGTFRFIKIANVSAEAKFANTSMVIKKLKDFTVSGMGNAYIKVIGILTYNDGSKIEVPFNVAFDRAIESFPGLPSELIVPDEFRNNYKESVADEIRKLFKLYQDSILTKDEFEAQKKKLLDQ
jgi:Short C-terminal domain